MKQDRNEALDQSLALLEAGIALDECLTHYPEHSTDLRSLIEIALKVRHVPSPTSSPAAFATGKRRMLQALAEKKQQQAVSPGLFSRGVEWIAALFKGSVLQVRAPAFQLTLVAIAAMILLAVVGMLLPSWIRGTATQAATLTQVIGAVEVMSADSDTWRPASVGERVEEGSRIRTDSLSAATLVFFDESTTDLEANTELAVTQMSSQHSGDQVVVLYQALGQTYSRVQPSPDLALRFEIETPTAVATVRGTEFALIVETDGTTHVLVAEGTVNVTAQETTVAVRAGQETTVHPKCSPVPVHPVCTATPTVWFTPTPEATKTPEPTETPEPTKTLEPTETPKPTETPVPAEISEPTEMPESPSTNNTPQPPGLTKTPQPPGQTRTPQPPAPTKKPKPTKKP